MGAKRWKICVGVSRLPQCAYRSPFRGGPKADLGDNRYVDCLAMWIAWLCSQQDRVICVTKCVIAQRLKSTREQGRTRRLSTARFLQGAPSMVRSLCCGGRRFGDTFRGIHDDGFLTAFRRCRVDGAEVDALFLA